MSEKNLNTTENLQLQDPSTIGVEGLRGINTPEGQDRERAKYRDFKHRRPMSGGEYIDQYWQGQMTPHGDEGVDLYQQDKSLQHNFKNADTMFDPYADFDPYEFKAQELATAHKWANGILKMFTTAGITYARGTATMATGIAESIYNKDFSYMFKNHGDQWLSKLEETIENEWLPNYYTEEELTRPWYENLGTANFWTDGVIKNTGFTIGAGILGAQTTALFGWTGPAAPFIGALYSAFVESKTEAIHTYDEMMEKHQERDEEYYRDVFNKIIEDDKLTNPKNYPDPNAGWSFGDEDQEEMVDPEGRVIKGPSKPKNRPSAEAMQKMQDLKDSMDLGYEYAEKQASNAGNYTLAAGTLFLFAPKFRVLGRMFRGGFDSTRKIEKHIRELSKTAGKEAAKQGAKKGTKKILKEYAGKKKSVIKEVLKDSGAEGFEEFSQNWIDNAAQDYYTEPIDEYYKALRDPNYTADTRNWLEELGIFAYSFGLAGVETATDIDTYEEVFMGAITPIFGFPMLNTQRARRAERSGRWVDWYGGVMEHRSLVKEHNENIQKHVDHMNKTVNMFNDFIDGKLSEAEATDFILNNNLQKRFNYRENKAIEDDDKLEFLNAVHSNLITDIMYFDNAGRLDEYVGMLEGALNADPTTLKNIVTMTSELIDKGKYVGPFIDANGKPLNLTEEGTKVMKEKIEKQVNYLKDTVKEYKKLGDQIDRATNGNLEQEHLNEMIWIASSIGNWEQRMGDIHDISKEIFSEMYESLKETLEFDGMTLDEMKKMPAREVIRSMEKLNALGTEANRKQLPKMTYFLGLLSSGNFSQFKRMVAENPKALDAVINILESSLVDIDFDKVKEFKHGIEDFRRMMEQQKEFKGRYDAFLKNPELIAEHQEAIDQFVSLRQDQQQNKYNKKILKKAKTFKQFLNMALSLPNSQKTIDSLAAKGNKFAKSFLRAMSAMDGIMSDINKAHKEQKMTEELADKTSRALQNALDQVNEVDELLSHESDIYAADNDALFEGIPNTESVPERVEVLDKLRELLKEYEEGEDWKEGYKTRNKENKEKYSEEKKRLKKELKEFRKKQYKRATKKKKSSKTSPNKKESKVESNEKESNEKKAENKPAVNKEIKKNPEKKKEGLKLGYTDKNNNKLSLKETLAENYLFNFLDSLADKGEVNSGNIEELLNAVGIDLFNDVNHLDPKIFDIINRFKDGKINIYQTVSLLMDNRDTYEDNPKNTTTAEMAESNSMEKSNPELLVVKEEKKHLYDAVPELYKTKDGRVVPFHEAFEGFKDIYEFLQKEGKFEFLNKGLLNVGDEIFLTVNKELNKKIGGDAILFTTKDGQVIGVLQKNQKGGNVLGLSELRKDVLEKAAKAEGNYTYPISTKVNKIMDGTFDFVQKEVNLREVQGLDPSTAILSISKNGVVEANNTNIEAGQLNNSIGKDGRIYLQVKNPSGRHFPIMVQVRSLNQVGVNSDAFRNSETGKALISAITKFVEAKNEAQLASAREELATILYINDIKINKRTSKRGEFISISRVETDSNGVPLVKWDNELQKNVRVETESDIIDLSNFGETTIEIGDDGSLGEAKVDNDVDKIVDAMLNSLLKLTPYFQVDFNMINTPGYNERLINDGLLSTNLETLERKNTWFIADPIIDGKSTPVKYGGAVRGVKANPVDTTRGNSFRIKGKDYSVENGKIYDKNGHKVSNHPQEQLLLDLDWAKRTYGNNTNGLDMRNGVVLVAGTDRVLNTKKFQYLEGKPKEDFLNSIGKKLNRSVSKPVVKDTKQRNITEIINEIEENQKNVDKESTDGENYYIREEDGKTHPYERTTQAIGSNFVVKLKVQEEIDSIEKVLSKLKTHKEKDAYYRELVSEFGIEIPDGVDGASIKKANELIFREVKDAILNKAMPNRLKSLEAGTAIDGVIRDFFMGKETMTKPENMSQYAYKELLASLNIIKKTMEDNGQEFLTNNIVLYHKYKDGRRVAGEVDILAVNRKKNQVFIYDVKTSRYSFYDDAGDLSRTFTRPWSEGLRSTKELYTMQLSAYKNLFENQYKFPVSGLAILPFHIKYDENGQVLRVDKLPGIIIIYDPKVNVNREDSLDEPSNKPSLPTAPVSNAPTNKEVTHTIIDNSLKNDEIVFNTPKEYNDDYSNPQGNATPLRVDNGKPGFFQDKEGNLYKSDMNEFGEVQGVPMKYTMVYVYENGKPVYKESHIVLPNGISLMRIRDGVSRSNEEILKGVKDKIKDPSLQKLIKDNIKKKLSEKSKLVRKSINKSESVKAVKNTDTLSEKKETTIPENSTLTALETLESSLKGNEESSDEAIINELLKGKRTAGAGKSNKRMSAKERRAARKKKIKGNTPRKDSLERVVDDLNRKLWDKEKEMAWLEKALPQLSREDRVRIVEGVIEVSDKGVKAWGQLKDNLVILSDVAAEGTLYHEAFHAVFNLILNDSARDHIFTQLMKDKDNKGKSFESLEEMLAEEFREYAMSRGTIVGKVKNFLKNAYDKILSFLNIAHDINTLDSLYKDIYDGNFAQHKLNYIDENLDKSNEMTGENEMYHGSAATHIDSFDYNFLLSGEGATAFTAGFYFTTGHLESNMYRLRAISNKANNFLSNILHPLNNITSLLGSRVASITLETNKVVYDFMSTMLDTIGAMAEKYRRIAELDILKHENQKELNKLEELAKLSESIADMKSLEEIHESILEKIDQLELTGLEKLSYEEAINDALDQVAEVLGCANMTFITSTYGDMINKGQLILKSRVGGLFVVDLKYDTERILDLDQRQTTEKSKEFIDKVIDNMANTIKTDVLISALSLEGSARNQSIIAGVMEDIEGTTNEINPEVNKKLLHGAFVEPGARLISFIRNMETILSSNNDISLGKAQQELTNLYVSLGYQGATHVSGHSRNRHMIMYDTDAISIKDNLATKDGINTKSIYDYANDWVTRDGKIPLVSEEKQGLYVVSPNIGTSYADNGVSVVDSNRVLAEILGVPVNKVNETLAQLSDSELEPIKGVFNNKIIFYSTSGYTVLGDKFIFNSADKKLYTDDAERKVPYGELENSLVERGIMVPQDKKTEKDINLGKDYVSDYLYEGTFGEKSTRQLNDVINDFLAKFGVSIKNADQMSENGESFIDIASKTIFAKTQEDIPSQAGKLIAFMMQHDANTNSLLREMVAEHLGINKDSAKVTEVLESNPDKYINILGDFITTTLKEQYNKINKDKSLLSKLDSVKDTIKRWFNKMAYKEKVYFKLLDTADNISKQVIEGNEGLILDSQYRPKDKSGMPILITEEMFIETENVVDREFFKRFSKISVDGIPLLSLTGSTALALQGRIYRPFGSLYNNIEFSANPKYSAHEVIDILLKEYSAVPTRFTSGKGSNGTTSKARMQVILSKASDGNKSVTISDNGVIRDIVTNKPIGYVDSNILDETGDIHDVSRVILNESDKDNYVVKNVDIYMEGDPFSSRGVVYDMLGDLGTPQQVTNYRDILNNSLNEDKMLSAFDYNRFVRYSFEQSDISRIPTTEQLNNKDRVNSLYNISNAVNSLENSDVFALLGKETKLELQSEGITPQMYDQMSQREKENLKRCLGI